MTATVVFLIVRASGSMQRGPIRRQRGAGGLHRGALAFAERILDELVRIVERRVPADEPLEHAERRDRQIRQAVAALLQHHDAPPACAARRLPQCARHVPEPIALHAHAAERIERVRILPRRHENELRRERLDERQHQLVERVPIARVARAGRQRHVRVVARARAAARLARLAAVDREIRRLVQRHEQYRRIVVERLLRAVAVMHVPVDDRHPLDAVRGLRMARRDRDVVVVAVAHREIGARMVARRPDQRIRLPKRPRHHRIDSRARGARREPRDVFGRRAARRVVAEPHHLLARHRASLGELPQIFGPMHAQQLLIGRTRESDARQALGHADRVEQLLRIREPQRAVEMLAEVQRAVRHDIHEITLPMRQECGIEQQSGGNQFGLLVRMKPLSNRS
ncbi:hypothetical protein Y023_5101 [Burkholderia pseudomallei A79D]|nr:hypothetical protein Y023_5101 [Burkholderia pseudomallei A79D]KGX97302.1 hypothetical protein X997_4784 [Burkholderia pseudomallei A79C]